MVRCGIDGTWCCGPITTDDCCARNDRLTLAATLGQLSTTANPNPNPASVTTMSTSGATAATISASISSPIQLPSTSNSSLVEGIGIGLGVGFAFIIIAAAAGVFYFRRRKRLDKNDRELQHDSSWQETYRTPVRQASFHEVDGNTRVLAELQAQYHRPA